jgi:hypothetical protein
MSACERLALVLLLISPLVAACSGGDTCVRNSDCPSGLGCSRGRCAVVNPPPPSDASRDAPEGGAPADAGGDRDSSVEDAPVSSDAGSSDVGSADTAIEADVGPDADAADDVTDAGSESSD